MPTRHEAASNALECAIFGLPEPRTEWKKEIPTLEWEMARGPGSPNINGMAAVAHLYYSKAGREREVAIQRLRNYVKYAKKQWLLAEPESGIYRTWHLNYLAGAVELARRQGLDSLANEFLWFLEEDAERSALMTATLHSPYLAPNEKAPRTLQDRLRATISDHVGERVICRMGARSWGSGGSGGYGLDAPWQQIARAVLFGGQWPKAKGTPGEIDGFHWTMRVANRLRPIFEEAGAEAKTLSTEELVAQSIHWSSSHAPFQYLGWEDGSRLCVMSLDEPEFVDSDPNSNTPGVVAYGVVGGRLIYLPEWPNPIDGDVKIRQENMRADVDLDWADGRPIIVRLAHSHIGRKNVDGYLRSSVTLDTSSPLAFHLVQRPWQEWEDVLEAEEPPADPPPPPVPPTQPPPKPKDKKWWEKIEWTEL